jgi:hypothetical protein
MGCFRAWFALHDPDETKMATNRRLLATYNEQVRTALAWL